MCNFCFYVVVDCVVGSDAFLRVGLECGVGGYSVLVWVALLLPVIPCMWVVCARRRGLSVSCRFYYGCLRVGCLKVQGMFICCFRTWVWGGDFSVYLGLLRGFVLVFSLCRVVMLSLLLIDRLPLFGFG